MAVVLLLALGLGMVAGLRTMTAPTAIVWAVYLGAVDLSGTWFAFLAHPWAPWIATVLAIGEFVADKLPSTPSRKVPLQFGARIVMGGLCGAAVGMAAGSALAGAAAGVTVAGVVGAVVGTLAGAAARARLAAALGRDLPAALIEDMVAVGGAAALLMVLT